MKPLGQGCYLHLLNGMIQSDCWYLLLEEARYFHLQDPILVVENCHIFPNTALFHPSKFSVYSLEAVNSPQESKECMPSCVMHVTVTKTTSQQTGYLLIITMTDK